MEEDIPPDLNTNDDGSEEIPDEVNSELIKLVILPNKSPIGTAHEITSISFKKPKF